MEYYGKPIPAKLPGSAVLNARELDVYASTFSRTGFTPAINWYRNISHNWRAGLSMDQTVRAPSLMISGEHDVVLRLSMAARMEAHVPNLERRIIRDCWYWTPEERPDELNKLMVAWLNQRIPPRWNPRHRYTARACTGD